MCLALEWVSFFSLSAIVVFFAFSMLRPMSMVRAGVYLMTSFCAVAALSFVLSADLVASMQIMMSVGCMLAHVSVLLKHLASLPR